MAGDVKMTPQDLKALVDRHERGVVMCSTGHTASTDRGALLDLLRRVAMVYQTDRFAWHCTNSACSPAMRRDEVHHAADCPAPLLEVLR